MIMNDDLVGIHKKAVGRATAQSVSRRLPTVTTGFNPRYGHEGYVVDKVALEKVAFQ
jgi:hypothetical protein